MSRYEASYPGKKDPRTRTKGIKRQIKEQKRLEAEARDALLAPDDPRRKAVRLGNLPEPEMKTPKRRRNRNKVVENPVEVPV